MMRLQQVSSRFAKKCRTPLIVVVCPICNRRVIVSAKGTVQGHHDSSSGPWMGQCAMSGASVEVISMKSQPQIGDDK